jgi:hypothetical protein
MTNGSDNPFQAPSAPSVSSPVQSQRAVYRYSDLPHSCPRCEQKFSELLYRKLYPKRYRWHTIAFIVVVTVVALALLGWLGAVVFIPLGGWAMTWRKKVRVYCVSCGWAQTFIVS